MIPSRPLPAAADESAGFFEGAQLGELRVQACDDCGRLRHPPRPMCPRCGSMQRSWRAVPGAGALWSYALPHPPLLPAFEALGRYNVAVVALDVEPQIRLVGNIVVSDECHDMADPSLLSMGAPVAVTFAAVTDEVRLPVWYLNHPGGHAASGG